jgi:hypothetical protein
MGRQSDDQLRKLHKTAAAKDQSSPANKSFTKRIEKEMKKRGVKEEVEIDEGLYSIKNTKTGQTYAAGKYMDDKKLDKIRKGGGDHKHAAHYKDGKMIEEVEIGELSKEPGGILQRASSAAKKKAEVQRDAQAWAKRVPGKGHAFGAKEAGEKAAKREKQAAKFDAAVDVKQRDTAFKKEKKAPVVEISRAGKDRTRDKLFIAKSAAARPAKEKDIDEKESDYADKIKRFKEKGGTVEKQPPGPISKSLFRTTVGREKRRNPGKQATRDTFYDEVEVSEGAELQAKMALDDAGIKYSTKNNSLTVKKKDLKKAQLAFEKSFKKGGWPKLKVEEVEVKEWAPVVAAAGAMVRRAVVRHVVKKAINKVTSKEDNVNELSKELLDRAAQGANRKADQQRDVSAKAASRVGDTSQPPGQNIKSKRAGYQAAKKDYQAFKFGIAAKKKEKLGESNKLQADMALSDAGIKSYWEDGKLWVDKKDVVKAEKTLSKSFKKGGEPHIYYKGGFLGVWNKKRKITGG